jgi:hypothetical protein
MRVMRDVAVAMALGTLFPTAEMTASARWQAVL